MVSDQQLRKSSQMCVDLKHKQDGSSKHKQVPSDDSACIQLLTNSGEYAQVTASSYLASSNLKQQSLASSDHNVDCDHRHVLRRSDVSVGG
ncbi:hypothetical protein ACOSQ2_028450 [Xanthoceras sorbifolium]